VSGDALLVAPSTVAGPDTLR